MALEEIAYIVEHIVAPLLWLCVGIILVKIFMDIRREVREEHATYRKLLSRLDRPQNGS